MGGTGRYFSRTYDVKIEFDEASLPEPKVHRCSMWKSKYTRKLCFKCRCRRLVYSIGIWLIDLVSPEE